MKTLLKRLALTMLLVCSMLGFNLAHAQADLEVNTPAIKAVKASMKARHGKLNPFYSKGVVGLTADGLVAIKDAGAVALKDRGKVNALVQAENADRAKLYREIAAANGHPEWQAGIQKSFAKRWIAKAKSGWFYKKGSSWTKK